MSFLCVSQMQNKKSTSKDKIKEKQKNKSKRKRKTNSVPLCPILPKCTGSVNCARADRVTSNIYRVHFRFLSLVKERRLFIRSSLFRRVSIKANVGNIAMHSFFEIMLFSENYEFFNNLKFSQNYDLSEMKQNLCIA